MLDSCKLIPPICFKLKFFKSFYFWIGRMNCLLRFSISCLVSPMPVSFTQNSILNFLNCSLIPVEVSVSEKGLTPMTICPPQVYFIAFSVRHYSTQRTLWPSNRMYIGRSQSIIDFITFFFWWPVGMNSFKTETKKFWIGTQVGFYVKAFLIILSMSLWNLSKLSIFLQNCSCLISFLYIQSFSLTMPFYTKSCLTKLMMFTISLLGLPSSLLKKSHIPFKSFVFAFTLSFSLVFSKVFVTSMNVKMQHCSFLKITFFPSKRKYRF